MTFYLNYFFPLHKQLNAPSQFDHYPFLCRTINYVILVHARKFIILRALLLDFHYLFEGSNFANQNAPLRGCPIVENRPQLSLEFQEADMTLNYPDSLVSAGHDTAKQAAFSAALTLQGLAMEKRTTNTIRNVSLRHIFSLLCFII